MAGSMQGETGRMGSLDLMRLAAALAVVGFHYLFRGGIAPDGHGIDFGSVADLAIYGYLGVNLFFLISGFVIAWSAEGRTFTEFAIARFARLYPGFLLCMTVTFAVLAAVRDPDLPVSVAQYAANLAMLSPAFGQPFMDGVYWSIVLEVIFYAWVGLALMLGVFERWKLTLILAWLIASGLNEFAIGNGALRLLLVTEYSGLFIAGVLFRHLHAHGRSPEALALLAAAVAFSTATMVGPRQWMLEHYGVAVSLPGLVVANLAIHALFVATILVAGRIPSSRLVIALGGLTYPLYLLHQNIGYVAIERLAPVVGPWTAAVATTALMVLLSLAVWRYFEMPARSTVRRRLAAFARALGSLPLTGRRLPGSTVK